jgi:hypothetical protein
MELAQLRSDLVHSVISDGNCSAAMVLPSQVPFGKSAKIFDGEKVRENGVFVRLYGYRSGKKAFLATCTGTDRQKRRFLSPVPVQADEKGVFANLYGYRSAKTPFLEVFTRTGGQKRLFCEPVRVQAREKGVFPGHFLERKERKELRGNCGGIGY